ncbi:aspartoacylase [Flagellimonas aquimarina]|uniref:Aspartoacylase n=1 Tax=Flagellimonas aquimarina TaxID=2201895 RepID=A0A316L384_9FLAO|nr:succinylglutamate desuccinylase/aspartoacylase family protein [Allomuricauda koreensis]PWL39379.1 aspartoacylase [Allomuricauda koreensis]
MSKVYSNALNETLEIGRIIGHLKGEKDGPTVVFFAGIHGNEPAGIFALKHVMRELKLQQRPILGQVYAIAGNLRALEKQTRFIEEDLNRIWLPKKMNHIQQKRTRLNDDENELLELHDLLNKIIGESTAPFYFIDLHTTSGETSPFVVLNDSLLNRKFASNYPLPIILGIEEYLEGALLSFINELGYVSLGYESGQHDEISAINNCIEFINLTLALTTSVGFSKSELTLLNKGVLKSGKVSNKFYEIYYQYTIKKGNNFKMLPGFVNFQKIPKGKEVALDNDDILKAKGNRQIFMPLYQNQGSEGFYYIRSIPKILLWVSKGLRRLKADHLLVKFPGIEWESLKKDAMLVDQRVARFLAKSIFHLLGYRARQLDKTHLLVKSREIASKNDEYLHTDWF